MPLRDFQQTDYDKILDHFGAGKKTSLLVQATGLGKTHVFSHVAKTFMNRGRVMILVDREELVYQARDEISAVCGVAPAIEMNVQRADDWRFGESRQVVVSTIQTQISGRKDKRRMHKFRPDDFSLVIEDEAHLSNAPSWREARSWYRKNPNLCVLGATATPNAADKKPLDYEAVVDGHDILFGIDNGWLVPIIPHCDTIKEIDISAVDTTMGDLNMPQYEKIAIENKPLHGAARYIVQHCGGRPTLVFAPGVEYAHALAGILNLPEYKPGSARAIDGKSDKEEERPQALVDFHEHKFQYLINVGCFTTGFDEDEVRNIVMLRPTKVARLFIQMIGRGTRTLYGTLANKLTIEDRRFAIACSAKPDVHVFDPIASTKKHKLITVPQAVGQGRFTDREIALAERMTGRSKADVLEQLRKAHESESKRLEQIKQKQLRRDAEAQQRGVVYAKSVTVTSEQVDLFGHPEGAPRRDYIPTRRMATPGQIRYLEGCFKVANAHELTQGQAGAMINAMKERKERGVVAVGWLIEFLRKNGIPSHAITETQAREHYAAIKANGGRVPPTMHGLRVQADPGNIPFIPDENWEESPW